MEVPIRIQTDVCNKLAKTNGIQQNFRDNFRHMVFGVEVLVENMQCLVKDLHELMDKMEVVSKTMNNNNNNNPFPVTTRKPLLNIESFDSDTTNENFEDNECPDYWIDYNWSYLQLTPTALSKDTVEQGNYYLDKGIIELNDNRGTEEGFVKTRHSLMSVDSPCSEQDEFDFNEPLFPDTESKCHKEALSCCETDHSIQYCDMYENLMEYQLENLDTTACSDSGSEDDEVAMESKFKNSRAFKAQKWKDNHEDLTSSTNTSQDSFTLEDLSISFDADSITRTKRVPSDGDLTLGINTWKNYSTVVPLADLDSDTSIDTDINLNLVSEACT